MKKKDLEFQNDFIAFEEIKNSEAADKIVYLIEWDNWHENNDYFKVESVIWNRLMSINEDEDTYQDEKEDVYELIDLYFKAVDEKVENLESIDSTILEKYFEELTIEYATYQSFLNVYINKIDNSLVDKIKEFLKDNQNTEMHILMDDELTTFEAVLIDTNTSNDFIINNSNNFEESFLIAQNYSNYLEIEFDEVITKDIYMEKNTNCLKEFIQKNTSNEKGLEL